MKSRFLTFKPEIEGIIRKCDVCYLSMVDENNEPYIVPMNFGYHDDVIYFHASQTGKKVDILKNNPRVCVSFSTDHQLRYVNEEVACSWGMRYRSILAYGSIVFVDNHDDKIDALNHIMKNYTDRDFGYKNPAVTEVLVFKLPVEKFEAKVHGY